MKSYTRLEGAEPFLKILIIGKEIVKEERRNEKENRLGIVSRTIPVASGDYFNYRINRCIHQGIMQDR